MTTKSSDIHQLLSQQNELLSAITLSLDKSGWVEALVIGICVAIAGALSAYGFTWFHWRRLEAEAAKTSLLRQLHDLVEAFEKLCLEYWLSNGGDRDAELAIRIQITHRMIHKYARIFGNLQSAPALARERFFRFSSQIYDEATGGDFQGKGRKLSRSKANTIARQCSDARALLNELVYRNAL